MTNQQLELIVQEKTQEFVKDLNGRFNKHVSDAFIASFINNAVMNDCRRCRFSKMHSELMMNIAYRAAIPLFETHLEYGCKAGGNGHHVAQAYSGMYEEFDLKPYFRNSPIF